MTGEANTLYRAFDSAGALLYVGIAESWPDRFRGHKRTSEWFSQIATLTLEVHSSRDAARAAERAAIEAEHPAHNTVFAAAPRQAPKRHNRTAARSIRSSTFANANSLASGKLAEHILILRSAGCSFAQIARRLHSSFGIEVSAVTLADWHDRLTEEQAA